MPVIHPLPFRLKIPDEDTLDMRGVRSVSYQLEGLLHLEGETLTFEWAATRHTETVSLRGVKDYVDESPIGTVQVPRSAITRVVLRGRLMPRLHLWAKRIDAFNGIPSARPGALTLRLRRQDRDLARAMADAITGG